MTDIERIAAHLVAVRFLIIIFELMIFGCTGIMVLLGIIMAFIAPNWTPWQ